MARDGADDGDVAECVMRGVELDIKRDNGAPAFSVAVDAILLASGGGDNGQRLLASADAIRRDFVDSPLTRHFAAAMETVGLSAIAEGCSLSRQQAAEKLIVHFAESRCCDGMTGYVARNRTKDVSASHEIVGSIKSKLGQAFATHDLAARMLNCSPKGLPAKAARISPVSHTVEGLNNDEL